MCCRKALQGPEDKAPEVHEIFCDVTDIQNAQLWLAGDTIVPTENDTTEETIEELLEQADAVLTLSGDKFVPVEPQAGGGMVPK